MTRTSLAWLGIGAAVLVAVLVMGCGARAGETARSGGAEGTTEARGAGASSGARSDRPSVGQVVTAMNAVTPGIRQCMSNYPGAAIAVQVRFQSSGAATTASVDAPRPSAGPDDGARSDVELDDTSRRCVEAALLTAQVPAFSLETFAVRFPFRGP